jgi:hypothetical protein
MSIRFKSGEPMHNMNIDGQEDLAPRRRAPLITRYPPPKTTACGLVLLIGGIFFLTFGLTVFYTNLINNGHDSGIAMIVLGGLSKWLDTLYFILF